MNTEHSDPGTEPRAISGRILVLDDEPLIREFVARSLQAGGHEVVTLTPADGALELIGEARFDLVVTNSVMPAINGARLVARLRRRFPELPVLHLDDVSHPRAVDFPPDVPVLDKPFSSKTLRLRVQELLMAKAVHA